MAFGRDQDLQLLREIVKLLSSSSTGGTSATAANQLAQIALETAMSNYLATIATDGNTTASELVAIEGLITTLNTIIATSAKQDLLIALANPTDKYGISETDRATTPYYYGFVDKDGGWYIMKEVVNSATSSTFTYVTGASNFSTAWTARASQTYVTFNTAF